MIAGNSVPVATVRVPLTQAMNNNTENDMEDRNLDRQQGQDGSELLVERSSPGGLLGSQVSISGRRESISQEQWRTPTTKRNRSSRGSPTSPGNQDKRSREQDWVWDRPHRK